MKKPVRRKELSAQGLYRAVRTAFDQISDPKRTRKIPLPDVLMSGLAMFSLKYPSLLQFDRGRNEKTVRHNLRTLFGVQQAPCDTTMRERLDEIDPKVFEKAYKKLFALLQRGARDWKDSTCWTVATCCPWTERELFRPGRCMVGTAARNTTATVK